MRTELKGKINLILILILFFGTRIYSQDIKSGVNLPLYKIRDSSFTSICEISSYVSERVFKKHGSNWFLDCVVKPDTVYYYIAGSDWPNSERLSVLTTVANSFGMSTYKKHNIFIGKKIPEMTDDFLFDDVFISKSDTVEIEDDFNGNLNTFTVFFSRKKDEFVFHDASMMKKGKVKEIKNKRIKKKFSASPRM